MYNISTNRSKFKQYKEPMRIRINCNFQKCGKIGACAMATLFPGSREKETPREREVGAMLEKIAQDFNSSVIELPTILLSKICKRRGNFLL